MEGDELDLKANGRFMRDAAEDLKGLEKWMDAIEIAVKDVVAARNSLDERGLLVMPDPQVVAKDQ